MSTLVTWLLVFAVLDLMVCALVVWFGFRLRTFRDRLEAQEALARRKREPGAGPAVPQQRQRAR